MPDYARELHHLSAMSHESEQLLQTLRAQHDFADLLGGSCRHTIVGQIRDRSAESRLCRIRCEYREPTGMALDPVGFPPSCASRRRLFAVRASCAFVTHATTTLRTRARSTRSGVALRTAPSGNIDAVLPELKPGAYEGHGRASGMRCIVAGRIGRAKLGRRFGSSSSGFSTQWLPSMPSRTFLGSTFATESRDEPAQVYWLCVPLQNRTYRRVARADLESAISIIDAMSEAVHRHDYVEIEGCIRHAGCPCRDRAL